MFSDRDDGPFGDRRRFLGRGAPWHSRGDEPWQGSWGGYGYGRGRGYGPWGAGPGGRVMPLLAAAFLAGAVMRRARFGYGGRRGHGPWGWGGDGAPDQSGGRRHGRPWRHGPWGHGPWHEGHEHEDEHGRGPGGPGGALRGLRPEVGALMALFRDSLRQGGPTAGQMDQIRAVLGDARKRIAAILAEDQSPPSMV